MVLKKGHQNHEPRDEAEERRAALLAFQRVSFFLEASRNEVFLEKPESSADFFSSLWKQTGDSFLRSLPKELRKELKRRKTLVAEALAALREENPPARLQSITGRVTEEEGASPVERGFVAAAPNATPKYLPPDYSPPPPPLGEGEEGREEQEAELDSSALERYVAAKRRQEALDYFLAGVLHASRRDDGADSLSAIA